MKLKEKSASAPRAAEPRRGAGGRPRKYDEPSRPITLTLPDRTLKLLESIDADRGKAIVKAVDRCAGPAGGKKPSVEIVRVNPASGLIVVGPSKALRRIPWLSLVEIAPSRYLLSVPSGTAVDSLEIALVDLLDDLPSQDAHEAELLQSLLDQIRSLRRSQRVTKGELLFVTAAR